MQKQLLVFVEYGLCPTACYKKQWYLVNQRPLQIYNDFGKMLNERSKNRDFFRKTIFYFYISFICTYILKLEKVE